MKIIILSCNLYADTCPAFSELWHKTWPDCPHDLVFVTNKKRLAVTEPAYYLNRRSDLAFGWRLRKFIRSHYTDEHLLFMMSDYFVKSIDSDLIGQAHELCALPNIRHVRLRPMPHPQLPFLRYPDFGLINKFKRYSLSLQPGIWETQVLYDLCRNDEDPWQTEVRGSSRAAFVPGLFLSTKRQAISHINYYRKGKVDGKSWVRENVSPENWPEACKYES